MSATVASKSKKLIKPMNPQEFSAETVKFGPVKNNSELSTKWVDTTYENNVDDKFRIVARGCVIKSFKKQDIPVKEGDKETKNRKDKFQIFMGVKDTKFIDMVTKYEDAVVKAAEENSQAWLDDNFNTDECRQMFKSIMSYHEKYGYAIGGILSRDFTCKSKIEEVPDVSDLFVALAKNNVIDACFSFTKIKLGAGKFSVGLEVTQINIVGKAKEGDYDQFSLKPAEFESGKITLTSVEQHEKGGKFCKMQYDSKPVRIRLENITGRIFKFEKEGNISYSMSIRMSEPAFRKMIEGIDEEIFTSLVAGSKEYYGVKKTSKLLKPMYKNIFSYNKTDQEKIKKGEQPSYDPSVWFKIYHSDEKGFDGKITNSETGKPITNTEELLNKDLSITSVEAYSRHIWFGQKTSVNFTLNKCSVNHETTEYDMDDIEDDTIEETVEETQEVVDSDNE